MYKIDSNGSEALLHSFGGSQYSDGQYPAGGLILDNNGNLYGTAPIGGTYGSGVVFELSPTGNETILHNFRGQPLDGVEPDGALTPDGAGNLFGTAAVGGNGSCDLGCGMVFKLTP